MYAIINTIYGIIKMDLTTSFLDVFLIRTSIWTIKRPFSGGKSARYQYNVQVPRLASWLIPRKHFRVLRRGRWQILQAGNLSYIIVQRYCERGWGTVRTRVYPLANAGDGLHFENGHNTPGQAHLVSMSLRDNQWGEREVGEPSKLLS